ncbi:MAG TPA: SRPBCC family protein [Actinomycetota bacterium]|nr:SRPBCC family protein [Actinomycetota bacterium]
MKVERSISVEREPEAVFDFISDFSKYADFFVGITKWESRSEETKGIDALYRVLMRVGSIEAGGTIRVSEWDPPTSIRWEADRGIRQRGSWYLAPNVEGTELTLAIEFDLSGGPVGALVERLAGRIVGRNMWATLLAARRRLEDERATSHGGSIRPWG